MSVLVNRQPKPKTRPVSGNCRWVVPIGKVSHTGVLEINQTTYAVTVLYVYGNLTGYRLEKLGGAVYDIDAAGAQWNGVHIDRHAQSQECRVRDGQETN